MQGLFLGDSGQEIKRFFELSLECLENIIAWNEIDVARVVGRRFVLNVHKEIVRLVSGEVQCGPTRKTIKLQFCMKKITISPPVENNLEQGLTLKLSNGDKGSIGKGAARTLGRTRK